MGDTSILGLLDQPHTADLNQVGRAFIDHVKTHIQTAVDTYDDKAVQREEEYLRGLFPKFFEFTVYWIRDEMGRHRDVKNHPDASSLKSDAKKVLRVLQDNIITFTIVSMHINRYMVLVRDEIKKSDARGINYDGKKKIKWTGDTGLMLGRNKRRKQDIDVLVARFETAGPLLVGAEKELKAFDDALGSVLGREDTERLSGSFRAGIRVANFNRSRTILREIAQTSPKFTMDRKAAEDSLVELCKRGEKIVTFFEEYAPTLTSEDQKVFLTTSELRIVQDSLRVEARKIRGYIVKYNLPYMEYKLDHLALLRDKLLVVGSLDSLMTLYLRLVAGMARPLRTLEDVRLYEAEVLGPIRFMQAGQFEEVPKIHQAANKTVEEFRHVHREYQDELEKFLGETDAADLLQNLEG